jgi:hypothetical protein
MPAERADSPALAWATRGVAVALAVVAGAVGIQALRNQDACDAAIAHVNAVTIRSSEAEARAAGSDAVSTCGAPIKVLPPIFRLVGVRHPEAAVSAATELTQRYPDSYLAWTLLATAEPDKAAARRAFARVTALRPNP